MEEDVNAVSEEIVIIGAGLTGLTLGYMLKTNGVSFRILESSTRVGGRIFTEGYHDNKPVELGATWIGDKHEQLLALLREIDVDIFPQEFGDSAFVEPISTSPPYIASLPPNNDPSFRIRGGTSNLIQTLADRIGPERIFLSEPVVSIEYIDEQLVIHSSNKRIVADKVISTLPPNLLMAKVKFEPALPHELISISKSTHTWMAESIKIALSYREPFWKSKKLSGTVLSNVGPISELYDHSNDELSFFALKGFFNGSYYSISKEERLEKVLSQLRKYYGSVVDNYITYYEKVWRNDTDTFYPYERHILSHENNGHQIFQENFYGGHLIIGGSETSSVVPGYMEGAVSSARMMYNKIFKST